MVQTSVKNFNPANMITISAVALGALVCQLILIDKLNLAFFIFPLILLFDKLDGMAARKFNCSSRMGLELDSLSDAINFTLVPVLMIFKIMPNPWLMVFGMFYTASGIWRLAKFNSISDDDTDFFIGLPTTNAAAWIYILLVFFGIFNFWHFIAIASTLAFFSILMISNFKYSKKSKATMVLYPLIFIAWLLRF